MRRNPFTRLKRHAEKLDLYERAQLFLSSVYYWDEEMIDMAMSGCPPEDAIEFHCHLNALIYVASFVVIRMTAYESNFYTSYTIASRLAVIDPDHKAAHCTEEFGMHWWLDKSAALWYGFLDFCQDFDYFPHRVLEMAPIERHPAAPTRHPITRQVMLFEHWRETDPDYPGPEKIRGGHKTLRKIYLTCLDQSTSI